MGERYVELIVTATPETVEAYADFLFAEGALGLALEDPPDDAAEILIRASFPGRSPIDPILNRLTAYQRALAALDFPGAAGRIEVREIPPADWAHSWKAHFKPLTVGKRLIIAPPWDSGPFPEDRLLIRIDPGMSFGTGHHATTRMCLEVLEAFIAQWAETRGPEVLDVGTGTGILAIAGAVLGAERVVAIDTDSEACEAAARNVSLSDVKDRIRISHAGVESIDPERRFDLAVANLDAKTLSALFTPLSTLLRPQGPLIASGLLAEEEEAVAATARACRLEVTATQSDGEWVCLLLRSSRSESVPPEKASAA